MKLIYYFKPKTFYKTLVKVIRNFKNRIFYKRQLLKLKEGGYLKQNNLRLDRRYRAYYVLNLEPETLLLGDEVFELEKSRVYESLEIKKQIFEKVGLRELIEAKTKRIKDSDYYAYLIQIKYLPMSNIWDKIYCLVWIILVLLIGRFLYLSIDYIPQIIDWVNNVMTAK